MFSLREMSNRARRAVRAIFSSSNSTTYSAAKGKYDFLWCMYLVGLRWSSWHFCDESAGRFKDIAAAAFGWSRYPCSRAGVLAACKADLGLRFGGNSSSTPSAASTAAGLTNFPSQRWSLEVAVPLPRTVFCRAWLARAIHQ